MEVYTTPLRFLVIFEIVDLWYGEVGRIDGKPNDTTPLRFLDTFEIVIFMVRRGGRVVEGARLESVWT